MSVGTDASQQMDGRIPVNEIVIDSKVEDEGFELCLQLEPCIRGVTEARLVYVSRVY
jgi:hypothetical protein